MQLIRENTDLPGVGMGSYPRHEVREGVDAALSNRLRSRTAINNHAIPHIYPNVSDGTFVEIPVGVGPSNKVAWF